MFSAEFDTRCCLIGVVTFLLGFRRTLSRHAVITATVLGGQGFLENELKFFFAMW